MPRTRADARRRSVCPGTDVSPGLRRRLGGGRYGGRDEPRCREDTLVACITGRNDAAREKLEQRFGDDERFGCSASPTR